MKIKSIFLLFILTLNLNLYSNSLNFNDDITYSTTNELNEINYYSSKSSKSKVKKIYGKKDAKILNLFKTIDLIHAIVSGAHYPFFITECVVGNILLVGSFTVPDYYHNPHINDLKTAHKILMIPSYFIYGINIILSFAKLGAKMYYKIPINVPHLVASIIMSALYFINIGTMVAASIAYSNRWEERHAIGISHGITSYLTTVSIAFTIITIPLGNKHKKILY